MAKFTILCCAFFLAAGAQAQSTPGVLQKIHDNVEAGIVAVHTEVQSILDDAIEKSNEVANNLKNQGEKLSQEMYEQLQKQLAETKKHLDDLVNNAEKDASECKSAVEILDKVALETIANMSVCVTDKIEQGNGYIESMIKITEDLKVDLDVIKKEADDCLKNVDGLIATAKAIACVNGAGAKATWTSMKTVPGYTQKMIQMSYMMSTLPIKLPFCAATKGLVAFSRETIRVTEEVKTCIKNKNQQ
ncbi:hypothetical protein HCN44_001962 [Aphidius gifuensis]|uniref:Venom protein n=1 Tax=Aphidius gifuensis TaxID=684658 RepID=A0A834XZ80_APHGI|nr:uncharacterized protein LOC122861214 [Aphidius gifuensis]KAF7996330.1 hypothetical protein HCN44_001962 [Aphidius gifuensis]